MSVHNFRSIFTLVVFLVAEYLVILPVYIPISSRITSIFKRRSKNVEKEHYNWTLPLDFHTAPVVAVLILLAAQCIHGEEVRKGIVGSDGVEPLNVMALFISLAYMVISVDKAGFLRFLAFWVATRSGSSGIRLYIAIYTFFFALGVVVGNDPVILSGVPFLAYFTREMEISPPTAWIFAQFVIANIASAVLVSSNPTNLVLSGAFSISFFTYTAKIIVPVLIAALVTLPTLIFLFRSPELIPREMKRITLSPRSVLVDPFGGIFGAVILVLTLVTLVATSFLHPQVYLVTVPPAVIVFLRDLVYDLRNYRKRDPSSTIDPEKESETLPPPPFPSERVNPQEQSGTTTPRDPKEEATPSRLHRMFPTVISVLKLMPFSLVLFSFSMFILIQGLVVTGWVQVWSSWWAVWANRTGPVGAVFGMGLISCILCNLFGTNIGATILLARVLQLWIEASHPPPRIKDAAIFALALGSNYGAFTFSFPASLAGLLWKRLLFAKGIVVTMGQFAKLNLLPIAVAMATSSAVLVGQVYIIHK